MFWFPSLCHIPDPTLFLKVSSFSTNKFWSLIILIHFCLPFYHHDLSGGQQIGDLVLIIWLSCVSFLVKLSMLAFILFSIFVNELWFLYYITILSNHCFLSSFICCNYLVFSLVFLASCSCPSCIVDLACTLWTVLIKRVLDCGAFNYCCSSSPSFVCPVHTPSSKASLPLNYFGARYSALNFAHFQYDYNSFCHWFGGQGKTADWEVG